MTSGLSSQHEIGATVKALRAELGMTSARLAEKVGVSQAQISRLETGLHAFRSGTLVKIAKSLKVPSFRLYMTDKEWAKCRAKKGGLTKAKDIGATLRALRTERGMTTAGLGKKAAISQAHISRLEMGKQGFRSGMLVKIAKGLRVPPFRLLMSEKEWAKWRRAR